MSYSFVKHTLQAAGFIKKKHRGRGRPRRRREPRVCFGKMVHLDGSVHPWLDPTPSSGLSLFRKSPRGMGSRIEGSASCVPATTSRFRLVDIGRRRQRGAGEAAGVAERGESLQAEDSTEAAMSTDTPPKADPLHPLIAFEQDPANHIVDPPDLQLTHPLILKTRKLMNRSKRDAGLGAASPGGLHVHTSRPLHEGVGHRPGVARGF